MTLCVACSDGDDSNGGGSGEGARSDGKRSCIDLCMKMGGWKMPKKSNYTMARSVYQFGNIILGAVMATGTICR